MTADLSRPPAAGDAARRLAAAITGRRLESVPHLLSLLMRTDPRKAGDACDAMLAVLDATEGP